jgi:hypothetical protein
VEVVEQSKPVGVVNRSRPSGGLGRAPVHANTDCFVSTFDRQEFAGFLQKKEYSEKTWNNKRKR